MHFANRPNRIHTTITLLMAVLAVAAGLLAALSLQSQKLYSPLGILEAADSGAHFYYGISIYITIALTLLTSVLIRVALRITK